MKNETHKEEELIERVKTQTEQLWQTIQEAKESNIKIHIEFDDSRIRPGIEITKSVYSQSREIVERIRKI